MGWDGNGTFTRTNGDGQSGANTWQDADAAGHNIDADEHDDHDQDLADGIQACVTKNGESKPTADFKPNADVSYSLGSALLRWVNGFFSGTLTAGTVTTTNLNVAANAGWRGGLSGMTLSNNATVYEIDVAAGVCRDSTNVTDIVISAAITDGELQATGAWAAGSNQKKLDSGARANSTWYHIWAIKKDSDGTGDWLYSTSATAPTMPAGYTYKRRIGSVRTNSGTDIDDFTQDGDYFRWAANVLDLNNVNSAGTSAVSRTLTVPTGVNVYAFGVADCNNGAAANEGVYFSDLASTDAAASGINVSNNSQVAAINVTANFHIRTNTSAQIRSRCRVGNASSGFSITTFGWFDRRGRDA